MMASQNVVRNDANASCDSQGPQKNEAGKCAYMQWPFIVFAGEGKDRSPKNRGERSSVGPLVP